MAKTKINYKDLSEADLRERLTNERDRIIKLKFAHAVTPLEKPSDLRATRREIARLLTELKARERVTS
jgi:large subunit ribosomal protein L29